MIGWVPESFSKLDVPTRSGSNLEPLCCTTTPREPETYDSHDLVCIDQTYESCSTRYSVSVCAAHTVGQRGVHSGISCRYNNSHSRLQLSKIVGLKAVGPYQRSENVATTGRNLGKWGSVFWLRSGVAAG